MTIDNTEDFIQSGAIDLAIIELNDQREAGTLDEDDAGQLGHLERLQSDLSDWGGREVTLIREEAFTHHVEELACDMYGVSDEWFFYAHIDWEAAAEQVLIDYRSLDFDEQTYFVRA